MQEYELWQLIGLEQEKVSEQFQFWMAATFAVVIASYTAGSRLALWARLAIAALYAASALVFFLRYMHAYDFIGQLINELANSSLTYPDGYFPSIFRRGVMIVGSIVALVLICSPTIGERPAGKTRPPEDQ